MEFSFNTHDLISGVFGLMVLIIGWFLRHLLKQREDEIKEVKDKMEKMEVEHKKENEELWKHHHVDADSLKDFKLEVAREHYSAETIDQKFDKFEKAMHSGFEDLKIAVDKTNDGINRLNAILLGRATDKQV